MDGLGCAEVSGDGDVVGLLKKGGAEIGGDIEAVMVGGVEEAIMYGEVGTGAVSDLGEGGLVERIGWCFGTDGVEKGGRRSWWCADSIEDVGEWRWVWWGGAGGGGGG